MESWRGSATLRAGDVVYFLNSGTWTSSSQQVLKATGGVTYDGTSWGAAPGRATFRATANLGASVVLVIADHASLATVVRGFHVDGGGYETTGIGVGWPRTNGSLTGTVKRIEDCVVHDCGHAGETGYNYGIIVGALAGNLTRNVEVLNCVVYNTGRTAIGNYVSNDTVANRSEHVLIRGCEVFNSGLDDPSSGFGIVLKNHVVGSVVEFNYVHDTWEGIGIDTTGPGFEGPQDAEVRYNIVRGTRGSGLYVQHSGTKSFAFYGNLVLQNYGYGLQIQNTDGDLWGKIFNNTFYQNCRYSGHYEVCVADIGPGGVGLDFHNNIVSSTPGRMAVEDLSGNKMWHESNLYYRPDGTDLVRNGDTLYDVASVTAWEGTCVTLPPGFKNTGNLPTGFTGTYGWNLVPNTDGLSILPGGAALSRGQPLGVYFAGAINFSGRSAGLVRTGLWDIGAYQREGPVLPTGFDFDGDGRADPAVFHWQSANWYLLRSVAGYEREQWGWGGVLPFAGDYDGDNRCDLAVFHPPTGQWFLKMSSSALAQAQWGWGETVPVPGDYDGDGKDDLAVYHPGSGTWYLLQSRLGVQTVAWGWSETIPVPADYDGDGRTDIAVYHPSSSTWYILQSASASLRTLSFGWNGTVPVPADYDGDGRADIAVFFPPTGMWYQLRSREGFAALQWGWSEVAPVPADYDGDGRADASVYHRAEGNWYICGSASGPLPPRNFGWSETVPVLPQYQINRWFHRVP